MLLQLTRPEKWGVWMYYTEETEDRPLAAYMRRNAQGCEQIVVDLNNIQADSDSISIGQVQIAADQQLVAYTIDTAGGGEVYEAVVQQIGGITS